jgi:choline dehydrogenase
MSAPTAEFDHVIVGAGTAGCLLANRLSADPACRVLLLEAGGEDRHPWIHIPVGYLYCIGNPRTDWCFRTEAEPGLNGRSLIYPRGRTLGGCSSINGMIYMRGQARDYEGWAAITSDDEWRWARVLPDFIAHESHHARDAGTPGADDPDTVRFHGRDGEWRVERQRLRWDILDAFAEAAVQAGIPRSADFNRGSNEGVGFFEVNQKRGWRWNTRKAFLGPEVRRRPNLQVWTQAQALSLKLQRTPGAPPRCTGVEVLHRGQRVSVTARREVVLAAGAIGTPQLMQVSGLGPGPLLQALGVPVLADLPGVGGNLQDHLQIRAVYRVRGALTLNTLSASLAGKARIALEYALRRSGPMSMAPSQLGLFTRSRDDRPHPDIQFHVQPLSLPAFGQPLDPYPAFTASVCNLNPESRGTVQARSPDATQAPAIRPNYLATEGDRRVAADSLRVVRRIALQPALARYDPQEDRPGPQYQGDEELARRAGDIATTIFHPVGTARMGRSDDPLAVCDARLRVRGVTGLRVADASVMPTITSGNTNSPTLMIAEKAARFLRAAH